MEDLLDYVAEDLTAAGRNMVSSSSSAPCVTRTQAMIGAAYDSMKELLEKDTPWVSERATFYLQRYTVDTKVVWLCDSHATATKGAKKYESGF